MGEGLALVVVVVRWLAGWAGTALLILKLLDVSPFGDWSWWIIAIPWVPVAYRLVVVTVTVILGRISGSAR